jgi:GntR family histidine utilization transcriptional repressor
LHFADDAPFQFEDRWINLEAVPRAEHADFNAISPNEWLVGEVPYTNAEVKFSAARADLKLSKLLHTVAGEPIFLSERTTWLATMPVTNVLFYFAPAYQMIARY